MNPHFGTFFLVGSQVLLLQHLNAASPSPEQGDYFVFLLSNGNQIWSLGEHDTNMMGRDH